MSIQEKWNIDYELEIQASLLVCSNVFCPKKTPLHLKVKGNMESEHVTSWLSHALCALERGRKEIT